MYTIEDLSLGNCAVINDGTLEELQTVLKYAFPNENINITGICSYYYKYKSINKCVADDAVMLPIQSVKTFIENISNSIIDNCNNIKKSLIKWCVRGCDEFEEWIDIYEKRNKISVGVSGKYNDCFYYILSDNSLVQWNFFNNENKILDGYVQISFEEFLEYANIIEEK